MWYVQFLFPNSAPYRYLTIKRGVITSTSGLKGAVIFQNKLQAISAAKKAMQTDKRHITSYRICSLEE